ncbi:hypothetical protein CWI39_0113p0010 [Hamiltosporidium magnivora]|uniref:Uncharacterized protein n=1 Tax=Hamiltosporidium magnivora TaxID=148818 RepID=A0A4Q9LNE6_9MICR|nr:hypothetical protein CWI39_0113p0010 [Hamiltosporidium magnivora]
MIWFSIAKSKYFENLDIKKVSFHFRKQEIFSHEFYQILSKEYFGRIIPQIKKNYIVCPKEKLFKYPKEETLNLYYNLFIVNLIGKTVEVFINLDLKYKLWEIECLIGYNIDFDNCSITFKELDLKLFTTKNITKENKIGKIVIRKSRVYSDFLKDIFAINELIIFNFIDSNIIFDKKTELENESIEYFSFEAKKNQNYEYFYELLNKMRFLKEKKLVFTNKDKFSSFVPKNLVSTKLYLYKISFIKIFIHKAEIKLLSGFDPGKEFKLIAKSEPGSLKLLFSKNKYRKVRNRDLSLLSIDERDKITFCPKKCKKMSLSGLFCDSKEYIIQTLEFWLVCIQRSDLEFILKMKQLTFLTFYFCNIPDKISYTQNFRL